MSKRFLVGSITVALVASVALLLVRAYTRVEPVNIDFERDGLVYNEECAIKIAEAIWLPLYGSIIYSSEPFKATLMDSVWVVEGTVHAQFGGAPFIKINKKDGKILSVAHYK
ncbi:MAG: hypothetical protein BroJett042_30580 [Bacteroidota bacterium]|nr:MAG: hypothetical protein BroJett042_30580 [Bacteroidota bacterium]